MKQIGTWVYLMLPVCALLVASQVLLKMALQRVASQHLSGVALMLILPRLPAFWLACVATGSAGLLWLLVVRSMPLSQVYPTISLSYVLMIPVARLLFGEAVTLQKVAGALIIVVGVAVLSRSL